MVRATTMNIGYLVPEPFFAMPRELGHAIYIKTMAEEMRAAGNAVTFLTRHDDEILYASGDEWTRVEVPTPPYQARLERRAHRFDFRSGFFHSARFAGAARRVLQDSDLLHEHFSILEWGGMWAARVLQKPRVLQVHSDDLDEMRLIGYAPRGVQYLLMKWHSALNYRVATKIVAVSDVVKMRLTHHWRVDARKIVVLPNAVQEMFFEPQPHLALDARFGIPSHTRVIVFVGSLHVWYDLPCVLRALVRVRETIPNAHVLLVGDGARRAECEGLVRELGIGESVTMAGCVTHQEIPALLRASEIAVLPVAPLDQEFWCSPMKLFEYMASGTAIAATATGQITQIVREGETARLVSTGDVEAWVRVLLELLRDPAQRSRLGQNALYAARDYTWHAYTQKLTGVYRDLLQSKDNAARRQPAHHKQ